MHKGRFCPRVVAQWLSADCQVPYFAPIHLRCTATFLYADVFEDVSDSTWREADVDEDAQTITYIGEFSGFAGHFDWTYVQSLDGSPNPLKITFKVTDGLGGDSTMLVTPLPGVFGYRDGFSSPNLNGHSASGFFGNVLQSFSYEPKPWR